MQFYAMESMSEFILHWSFIIVLIFVFVVRENEVYQMFVLYGFFLQYLGILCIWYFHESILSCSYANVI